ncbi:hypothetical protein ACIA48_29945 [Mycobacterium sp. NPDC051804]|uniref:hypothetical protein n=1 Tax=Mycobacterium sp. NPDC051804 TaxID=3364295 RepID=UPI0037BE166E
MGTTASRWIAGIVMAAGIGAAIVGGGAVASADDTRQDVGGVNTNIPSEPLPPPTEKTGGIRGGNGTKLPSTYVRSNDDLSDDDKNTH